MYPISGKELWSCPSYKRCPSLNNLERGDSSHPLKLPKTCWWPETSGSLRLLLPREVVLHQNTSPVTGTATPSSALACLGQEQQALSVEVFLSPGPGIPSSRMHGALHAGRRLGQGQGARSLPDNGTRGGGQAFTAESGRRLGNWGERGAWEGRQQLKAGEGHGSWGEEGSPHERAIEKG